MVGRHDASRCVACADKHEGARELAEEVSEVLGRRQRRGLDHVRFPYDGRRVPPHFFDGAFVVYDRWVSGRQHVLEAAARGGRAPFEDFTNALS